MTSRSFFRHTTGMLIIAISMLSSTEAATIHKIKNFEAIDIYLSEFTQASWKETLIILDLTSQTQAELSIERTINQWADRKAILLRLMNTSHKSMQSHEKIAIGKTLADRAFRIYYDPSTDLREIVELCWQNTDPQPYIIIFISNEPKNIAAIKNINCVDKLIIGFHYDFSNKHTNDLQLLSLH